VIARGGWVHAATLAAAGVLLGVYTVTAQARGEAMLGFLVLCIALLALAQWQGRRGPWSRRAGWWEWASATVTFVLVIAGWLLLDETDPTGPEGAPWSVRVVVVAAVALPLCVAGWRALRASRG